MWRLWFFETGNSRKLFGWFVRVVINWFCSGCSVIKSDWARATSNYRSRVILEKPTAAKLVNKFADFYGPKDFITVCTWDHHWPLSWARLIQSPSHPTALICSLRLSSGLFTSGSPTKISYLFLPSPICAACPAQLIPSGSIVLIIIWRKVQIMHFPPASCYFIPLGSKYSPQHCC
jgi:hypothetical protein